MGTERLHFDVYKAKNTEEGNHVTRSRQVHTRKVKTETREEHATFHTLVVLVNFGMHAIIIIIWEISVQIT